MNADYRVGDTLSPGDVLVSVAGTRMKIVSVHDGYVVWCPLKSPIDKYENSLKDLEVHHWRVEKK